MKFFDDYNNFNDTIKFSHSISLSEVSFLDVNVKKSKDLEIENSVYVKNTNIHQYVEYSSSHPRACKNGIPFSQAKRYRRIISNDDCYKKSVSELRDFFLKRNYPLDIVNCAVERASHLSQEQALEVSETTRKSIIPFVVEYNPSLPNIGTIIHKYWDLLSLSDRDSVRNLHSFQPVLAFKRPRNLKNFLVRSKFKFHSSMEKDINSSQKCNRRRCSHCKSITTDSSFSSFNTNEMFNLRCSTDCTSKNVGGREGCCYSGT